MVMWRNFRFQHMTDVEKSEVAPCVEEFQISHTTDVEKSEILPNLEEKILHTTDVKKSEIYPVIGCEICFVAIYAIFRVNCFVAIYALLRGEKLSQKLYRWRKNDKYEVWTDLVLHCILYIQLYVALSFPTC